MAELAELEARIRVLEDIEAIRKVKTKYWYCIDMKLWDDLGDCFAEDVVLEAPKLESIHGRKAFVQYLKDRLGKNTTIAVHQGHQSDIEITGDMTAKGIWALRDHLIDSQTNTAFKGRGFYEEEYVKEDGTWKIKSTKLRYLFTEGV